MLHTAPDDRSTQQSENSALCLSISSGCCWDYPPSSHFYHCILQRSLAASFKLPHLIHCQLPRRTDCIMTIVNNVLLGICMRADIRSVLDLTSLWILLSCSVAVRLSNAYNSHIIPFPSNQPICISCMLKATMERLLIGLVLMVVQLWHRHNVSIFARHRKKELHPSWHCKIQSVRISIPHWCNGWGIGREDIWEWQLGKQTLGARIVVRSVQCASQKVGQRAEAFCRKISKLNKISCAYVILLEEMLLTGKIFLSN